MELNVTRLNMFRLVRRYGQRFDPIEHVNFYGADDSWVLSAGRCWYLISAFGFVILCCDYPERQAWVISETELREFGMLAPGKS